MSDRLLPGQTPGTIGCRSSDGLVSLSDGQGPRQPFNILPPGGWHRTGARLGIGLQAAPAAASSRMNGHSSVFGAGTAGGSGGSADRGFAGAGAQKYLIFSLDGVGPYALPRASGDETSDWYYCVSFVGTGCVVECNAADPHAFAWAPGADIAIASQPQARAHANRCRELEYALSQLSVAMEAREVETAQLQEVVSKLQEVMAASAANSIAAAAAAAAATGLAGSVDGPGDSTAAGNGANPSYGFGRENGQDSQLQSAQHQMLLQQAMMMLSGSGAHTSSGGHQQPQLFGPTQQFAMNQLPIFGLPPPPLFLSASSFSSSSQHQQLAQAQRPAASAPITTAANNNNSSGSSGSSNVNPQQPPQHYGYPNASVNLWQPQVSAPTLTLVPQQLQQSQQYSQSRQYQQGQQRYNMTAKPGVGYQYPSTPLPLPMQARAHAPMSLHLQNLLLNGQHPGTGASGNASTGRNGGASMAPLPAPTVGQPANQYTAYNAANTAYTSGNNYCHSPAFAFQFPQPMLQFMQQHQQQQQFLYQLQGPVPSASVAAVTQQDRPAKSQQQQVYQQQGSNAGTAVPTGVSASSSSAASAASTHSNGRNPRQASSAAASSSASASAGAAAGAGDDSHQLQDASKGARSGGSRKGAQAGTNPKGTTDAGSSSRRSNHQQQPQQPLQPQITGVLQ